MSQTSIPGMIVAKEVDGIEMGVLEDGTPFLTGRGLAKACGVPPSVIYERARDWKDGKRDGKLARLLQDAGYDEALMYVPLGDGRTYAFIEGVCTIVIEYYAFENNNETAKRIYRVLARQGLKDFIYKAVGYDPRTALPQGWRDFHDRLLLSQLPAGYFSVFREMSEFLLRAIQAGLAIDCHTVPDISVGQIWSREWETNDGDATFGARKRFEHRYPEYYPQAASNPQEIWIYPVEALGLFRRWLDNTYIPSKFPTYLNGRVRRLAMDRQAADLLLAAVVPAQLESGDPAD